MAKGGNMEDHTTSHQSLLAEVDAPKEGAVPMKRGSAAEMDGGLSSEFASRSAILQWRRSRLTNKSMSEEVELVTVEERILCLQREHWVSCYSECL